MMEYQNIFTTVQVTAPDYPGVPVEDTLDERTGVLKHSYLMANWVTLRLDPYTSDLWVSLHCSREPLRS